jgi:protein-S-isoprenylcysteine O-methyltransferase Ste14
MQLGTHFRNGCLRRINGLRAFRHGGLVRRNFTLALLALMFPFLVWRLFDEERFLAANLDGYRACMAEVRWRLAPGLF